MTHWKEVPHLFANGKFKAKEYGSRRTGTVDGCNHKKWFLIDAPKNEWIYVHSCALIARPISDISDEEIEYLIFSGWGNPPTDYSIEWNRKEMIVQAKYDSYAGKSLGKVNTANCYLGSIIRGKDLLYLLSIGVYPFNQDEPEDVIWRYEND